MPGVDDRRREVLRHNAANAVTGVVERVFEPDGTSFVHKRLQAPDGSRPGLQAHWAASADPRHFNYWRREAEVYRSPELRADLDRAGLGLPDARVVEGADGVSLHLEDVAGRPGPEFDLEDHRALATALGRWQAAGPLSAGWGSRRFLRGYSTAREIDWTVLDDDALWRQPLVADCWPPELRDGWRRLHAGQAELLALMEALPRTQCHLDLWPMNEIRRLDGRFALLDWALSGDGAVGEDLGNHIPDSALDMFWPADRLDELEQTCLEAYLAGLAEAGWDGPAELARLGVLASCVKYVWLLPLMVTRAGVAEHQAYGVPVSGEGLFRQRGAVFTLLVRWADEALAPRRVAGLRGR